mmetsp:Transcript_75455/g.191521  ORF Transcript_75455/g.191521 Transcript_75455/m.191521 type:complete len:378 (+) Transcript_75455:25-1158(+)
MAGDALPEGAAAPEAACCVAAPAVEYRTHTVRTWRDASVDCELFERGEFADITFSFHTDGLRVDRIYGQAGLFAALSPVLRAMLLDRQGFAEQHTSPAGKVCRTLLLHPEITARAFREVARYAYGLQQGWTSAMLPEVLLAARLLGLEELEDGASAWGLEVIGTVAVDANGGQASACSVEDAMCSFERLCAMEPRPSGTLLWREALLKTFPVNEVLLAVAELELSSCTLRELLDEDVLHADAGALWQTCVEWAHARAGHGRSLATLRSIMSGSRSPRAQHSLDGPPPVDLRQGAAPRRLFGKTARLCQALVPAEPGEEEVAWQEPLLDVVDKVRFQDMPPAVFATTLEALHPVLPKLRQAIYASRRRAAREHHEHVG